jgi:hypothetical protein
MAGLVREGGQGVGPVPCTAMHFHVQTYEMQCFPLYSLIMAAGNRTINYFRSPALSCPSLHIGDLTFMLHFPGQPGHRGS